MCRQKCDYLEEISLFGPLRSNVGPNGDKFMKNSLKHRISVSTFWATTRVAVLDGFENYEDSYAITEEFREWITCIGENPELIELNTLMVPNFSMLKLDQQDDADEMLEI